jgi:hypothetical protein
VHIADIVVIIIVIVVVISGNGGSGGVGSGSGIGDVVGFCQWESRTVLLLKMKQKLCICMRDVP